MISLLYVSDLFLDHILFLFLLDVALAAYFLLSTNVQYWLYLLSRLIFPLVFSSLRRDDSMYVLKIANRMVLLRIVSCMV